MEEFTYEYLPWRGISKETMALYDVKTKVDKDGKPIAVGFKYPNGSHKIRWLDRKDFYWSHPPGETAKPGLFGMDKWSAGGHKYVTITEGELDALSLCQSLGQGPVLSVQGSSSAVRDCIAARSWLASFERIYLAFDNDEPGREAGRRVAQLFDFNRVYLVKFTKHKDANEYLQAGEGEDLRKIWWNSKKYLPETVISSFSDFRGILDKEPIKGVPYPFKTLNDMTYGIRTSESVLITAMEGVGKTELMHAIEYQLLQETKENVAAIFLEEPKRRHLQALAGIQLKRPVHLPDVGIGKATVAAALEAAVGTDDRLHIYSHFGSDDPDVLLDTIRFLVTARSCRYVLLDHISMVVSGLAGEDERKALDYFSTRLEMMVKELNFALIMVSHVNDSGQTRGSRYISKVADLRIDCVRDLLSSDPVVRNTTKLMVSKNRFSGKTGPAGKLIFDPDTYLLHEQTEEEKFTEDMKFNKELAHLLEGLPHASDGDVAKLVPEPDVSGDLHRTDLRRPEEAVA